MILGVGIDLVDSRRIQQSIDKLGNRFIERLFTKNEMNRAEKNPAPHLSYAKLYAVKEAIIKSIGHADGFTWHDMEISHNENGKPLATLTNAMKKNADQLVSGAWKLDISISDEPPYATAIAILSRI